ncbi:hypothetical protein P152DRAFT_399572 [Eremomyces bilateralis CBS 781.70]|uniref:DNA helicase n=1 Tax=Eremomyces bilateralis CBS 781.70 TaxID=1392243 RepID=A0A6G1G059_9PEZI|nr:uncharacterized protein P152DRAFT_399572 [Eremomyces bilateralis CBS 781.70]KAF1811362.1 hypothetical protein P152DRAFT_399572 [Eremomyces bilateralis CBS 781.70]
MPVGGDLTLDDIHDREVRGKVQRLHGLFPSVRIMDLKSQLMLNRGNFERTFDWFSDLTKSDESESDDQPVILDRSQVKAPRTTAKRQLTNKKTIQEKWASTQRPAEADSDAKKPRRRLVQGVRQRSQSADADSTPKEVVEIDSDDDDVVEKSEYDDFKTAKTVAQLNAYLLKYINKCSKDDLRDVSNQNDEVIDEVLSRRPFKSITAVRGIVIESVTTGKNGRQRTTKKQIGDRLVESCLEILESYQAVDKLAAECQKLGNPMQEQMIRWGFDAAGAKQLGEMSFIGSNSPRDSGVGTPSPDVSQDDEIVPQKRRGVRERHGWITQPSIMSRDVKLKDYQVVGLNWLNLLWRENLSGILADEMGLGKTCQVIAFLTHLRQIQTRGVSIVVVPGSTLENWLREFRNFSPQLRVEPYYGGQYERPELRENIRHNIKSIDVIITTYDIAWKVPDNSFLRKLEINVAVFDEGHYLKNQRTQRHTSLMRIAVEAECRLLLTGTPLQNNLAELASILSFMMPEVFSRHKDALDSIFKYKAKTNDTDHKGLLSTQRIIRARSMMAPFILRRKKQQVLKDMPKKTGRVVYCDLSDRQRVIYDEILEKERQAILARQRGEKADNIALMSELRKASIHPLLFRRIYDDRTIHRMSRDAVKEEPFRDSRVDYVYEDMEIYSDFNLNHLCEQHPTHLGKYMLQNDEWLDSGKVAVLCDLLRTFDANGDRTLLFSQYTMMMDILERVLDHLDLPYCRIDGGTAISDRQSLIDEFTADTSLKVFMLSTKAGGTGINLAAANKVIIFDMSFNPQEDVQAENRAHRVGQTREVEVIRLVSRGTIEEKILGLGSSKLALDDRVAGLEGDGEKDRGGEEVEKKGAEMVEGLLAEELGLGREGGLKEGLLDGLKKAGLDMSAA